VCGVAGVFHYADPARQVDRGLLLAMTRTLEHRGPDDEGLYLEGPVGLGHRRLAIVDLTPTGHQPMTLPDGSAVICYNGECYNHGELRQALEARGVRFRGTSDAETVLNGLRVYGPGALADLAGIFGLAYWDRRHQRLLLARDPLGVKQLYYHDDGRRVVFASELKAVLVSPDVPREVDPEAVNQYLHFHTPLGERTFFKDIRQLRQGEYVEIDRRGRRARTYWQPDGFEPRGGSAEANVEQLRELLQRVVAEQLMSDVPVGVFFSGGIDSSVVAAFAKNAGRHLRCFGIHFTEQGVVDERPYQEAAAAALGLDLDLITLDGSSFPEDFLRLSAQQDSPVIGAAMLSMYHVSRLARRSVKVCLGGQAADELFAGYARYALVQPAGVVRSFLSRGGGSGGETADVSPVRSNLVKQLVDPRNLRRLARLAAGGGGWRRRYFTNFAKVPERKWRRVFPEAGFFAPENAWREFSETLDRSPARDPGQKVLHWDVQTYLPGLFHQDDRMSMANGLESRVPLADPRLVRFAFQTDFGLKLRGGATKWILRQAVADAIPEMVLNRRKIGFDTPAERWLRAHHRPFLHDLMLSSRARSRGFWDADAAEAVLTQDRDPFWFDMVWKLMSVEAWARAYLDRRPSAGGQIELPASNVTG